MRQGHAGFSWLMLLTCGALACAMGVSPAMAQESPDSAAAQADAAPADAADAPEDVDAADAPEEGDAPDAPKAPAANAKPLPKGDVVTLKNGKVLAGVQVVRESPTTVEVQVVPGVEPISIMRRQVASIDYDDLEASDIKEGGAGNMPAPAPGNDKGEVSPELAQKLGASVTEEALKLNRADVVETVTGFAEKVGAALEVLPEVQQLPKLDREWTVEIPAGTSFMTVLRETLPSSFPGLNVEIANDRVRLGAKAEAPEN